jgi:acyl-CoA synthetase (NDP forming)
MGCASSARTVLGSSTQIHWYNASFSPVFPPEGKIAMASQSGALGLAILALAKRRDLGLSMFVSIGNKADISGNDLLQYWEEDPGTDVVLLYLEAFKNPRRFARIARRFSRKKPIICIKGGRSDAGMRAAGSHTAALAGSDVPVEALFSQTGVIRLSPMQGARGSSVQMPARRMA